MSHTRTQDAESIHYFNCSVNMKLSVVVLVCIVVTLQFVTEGESVCCHSDSIGRCGDNTVGTPCCAHGPCNIFCCNCDRGCRNPSGRRKRFAGEHPIEIVMRRERSGHDIVALGDQDGDGKMSLDEGVAFLDHLPEKEVVKRSLSKMDLDGDGFLSPQEVELPV